MFALDIKLNTEFFPYSCDDDIPLLQVLAAASDAAIPFRHPAAMTWNGEVWVTIMPTVDGGGMLNVLDLARYRDHAHELGPLLPSAARARVANGTVIPSVGRVVAAVQLGVVTSMGGFEVFDSGGSFDVLLGKPWLQRAGVAHDYTRDELVSPDGARIPNEHPRARRARERDAVEGADVRDDSPPTVSSCPIPVATVEEESMPALEELPAAGPPPSAPPTAAPGDAWTTPKRAAAAPSPVQPPRAPAAATPINDMIALAVGMDVDTDAQVLDDADAAATPVKRNRWHRYRLRGRARRAALEAEELERAVLEQAYRRAQDARDAHAKEVADAFNIDVDFAEEETPEGCTPLADVIPQLLMLDPDVGGPARGSTMSMEERLHPDRVRRVQETVTVGDDLTEEQRARVEGLVAEYADVFTLDISEVRLVDFKTHRLGVPPGTEGPRSAKQKPLTEPQRRWLYPYLDKLEANDVVRRIPASAAKWVSAITLAPKDRGKLGMSLEELRRRANEELVKAGLEPMFEDVPDEAVEHRAAGTQGGDGKPQPPADVKWRLCQNFIALNKVSKQSSFPMGDLESKQQRVSGKRWICVADFMAGFNAIPIAEEDIPYTAFAVPGRGLYVTPRMSFGLTGAPNTFGEMVSEGLDELIGETVEPWVDDCAWADDDFEALLDKCRRFFQRCRECKLSLSAEKTHLFMSEAVFAGARISAAGIKPDLSKVAAVLDWPKPKNALEVLGFTGLTGHFRSLIRDYAKLAQPLTDLTRDVRPDRPKGSKPSKGAYKRALEREDVRFKWGDAQRQAFAKLKAILTTEPILKPPQYDRPFIVTTDGSKVGLGATLTQMWKVKDSRGREVEREFPVAYASKRTSRTEENYTPYLLEFAAIKFALDKFDKIVYGQPLELVTDCKALRDTLNSDSLSSTHTRWMESVIARNIVDVRHRPGVENQADGLSRKWASYDDRSVDGGLENVVADWEAKDLEPDLFQIVVEGDENAALRDRFKADPHLKDVVEWLTALRTSDKLTPSEARQARQRAREYVVEGGRLWRVPGRSGYRRSRVECVTAAEGAKLARECHAKAHWGRDLCETDLRLRYFWPNMRRDVCDAIQECSPCKAFGARHITSLLQPITRARPFQMVTGDYLSMPAGTGGYRTILLLVDVYTQYVWAYKSTRKAGTGAFTVDSLDAMIAKFSKPELFMTDGGRHFDCAEVHDYCERMGIEYSKTPPYSPWANGLVEGCNRLLLSRLRRYCQPDFVEDETDMPAAERAKHVPGKWPAFLDKAIADLNSRVLPAVGYSPRELLFGMALDDACERPADATEADAESVAGHLAFVDALRSDAHARILEHAVARKRRFDAHVREVEYEEGDLVQIYQDKLDGTMSVDKKLAAKWSGPMRIKGKYLGAWAVTPLGGGGTLHVSGRRLRRWIPARGTLLHKEALAREALKLHGTGLAAAGR